MKIQLAKAVKKNLFFTTGFVMKKQNTIFALAFET
jgi:hypothetical protein